MKKFKRQFVNVPGKIMIYSLGSRLRLEYLAEKQDSHQCVIISLSGQYVTNKDYRIRFMDTQGNPLDKDIESDLEYIMADIKYNYKGLVCETQISFIKQYFYTYMMDIMVSTALKRKTELLDFFDPQVWKDSEIELPQPTGNYETDYKMAYLREVQKNRISEEDERMQYPMTPEEAFSKGDTWPPKGVNITKI